MSPEPKRQSEPKGPVSSRNARRGLMILGLALAVGAGLAACGEKAETGRAASSPGAATVGGPFQMIDTEGRPADQTLLQGKWSAVFFGYTFCPDVCPTTLTTLGAAQKKLKNGDALQTVFMSVDPHRDTPAQLKTYLESPVFPRPIIGLTGSEAQVAAVAKAYKAYYAKGAGEGDAYLMDHNSAVYLMNPQGQFVTLIRPDVGPEAMAREIASAMGGR